MSCVNKTKIVEHDNGNIWKEFQVKNDTVLNGYYREYFTNEKLKLEHFFQENINIDTSFYYYKTPVEQLMFKRIWHSKDSIEQIEYYDDGTFEKKGFVDNAFRKYGKWSFYDKSGILDVVREYYLVNGEQYLNQEWYLNKNGDTLYYQSHYIKMIIPRDTFPLNKPVKALAILESSIFYEKNSEICVLLPSDGYSFNEDFSNEEEIKLDTFHNLTIDIKNQKWFPNVEFRHFVAFGKKYNTIGKKKVRGYVLEYYEQEPDSNDMWREEHKKYFEIPIYIKDSINNFTNRL